MRPNALIIFFKYPVKHKVKTRLAAAIGEEHALGLYNAFLQDIFATASNVECDIIAAVADSDAMPDLDYVKSCRNFPQRGADLGERMYNAIEDVFSLEYSSCVLIGCDCPDLPAHVIDSAFKMLASNDVVIGPSRDGGYYLIGFKKDTTAEELFLDVPWGTSEVLSVTRERISKAGLTCYFLQEWEDIDDYDGLMRFEGRHSIGESIHGNTARYLREHRELIYEKKI